jgi:DNA oxidative demethylase
MPRTGAAMSVRMTNCGALGWLTDRLRGYRYEPVHPETGQPWPPIPANALLDSLARA